MQETDITFAGFSWPAVLLLVAAAALVGWLTYRSLRRGGGVAWAAALLGLRLVALAGLAVALLQPQVVRRRVDLLESRVVVLQDGSLSMGMPAGTDGLSRQQVVARRLGAEDGLIDRLLEDHQVEFLRFGDRVVEGSRRALAAEEPDGMSRTDLAGAIREVREEHGGETLRAVVLLSDGQDTQLPQERSARRSALARELEQLAAPVFSLCPVDPEGLRDVGIARVQCSRLGFVRSRWTARVRIGTAGIDEGRLNVLLRRGENIVDVQRIRLQPDQQTYTASLGFTPVRTGRELLTIEVEPHPRETHTANNRTAVVLSVVRERIRVLQVAGRPSWDVRFLRRTLKQTPNVDLVSFFILRDPVDDPGGPTPNSYVNLIPFPTDELFTRELRTFDVIVFQNFDYHIFQPYPRDFGGYLRNVRRHVVENGAGFVMIGGDQSFDRGQYSGTSVEEILPVALNPAGGEVDLRPFQARLTETGRRHPITRVEESEEDNRALWDRMPELNGCHVLSPNSRAGGVLVENQAAGGLPVVVIGRAGKGRTLAVTTDETWRWGFQAAGRGAGNRVYLSFWRNALRWLVGETEEERLTLSVDSRRIEPGKTVRGSVRLLGPDYAPRRDSRVRLSAARPAGEGGRPIVRTLETDAEGRASFELTLSRPGTWRLEARARPEAAEGTEGTEKVPTDATFVAVETAGREMEDLRPDVELLRAVAEMSGGRFYDVAREQAPQTLPIEPDRVEKLLGREVYPLWDNWIVYAVVAGCLCLEWWLRRRRGVT